MNRAPQQCQSTVLPISDQTDPTPAALISPIALLAGAVSLVTNWDSLERNLWALVATLLEPSG